MDTPLTYKAFRRQLDEVLRRRDPAALSAFLIAVGEWHEPVTVDTEKAMWLMIAASPALKEMLPDAERWLMGHGYENEVRAILGERAPTGQPSGAAPRTERPPRARPTDQATGRRSSGGSRSGGGRRDSGPGSPRRTPARDGGARPTRPAAPRRDRRPPSA